MYCPECGKENKENARFCRFCGILRIKKTPGALVLGHRRFGNKFFVLCRSYLESGGEVLPLRMTKHTILILYGYQYQNQNNGQNHVQVNQNEHHQKQNPPLGARQPWWPAGGCQMKLVRVIIAASRLRCNRKFHALSGF